MQFIVSKEDILNALNAVAKATTTRGIQPVLSNILIDTIDAKHLRLLATDLDILIEAQIPASITQEGQITLQAKKLTEIVSNLPAKEVHFDVDPEKLTAKIKSGAAKFELMGIAATEFPATKKIDESQEVEVDLNVILKAIKQTIFAAATFETSNVLGGVFIKAVEDNFEVAATDGNRLAKLSSKLSKPVEKEITAIVPTRILNEVAKSAAASEDETIFVGISDGQVSFRLSDRYFLSRLLEGKYPDYHKLLPESHQMLAVANKEDLMASIKRTAVMANERTNIIKLDFQKHQLFLTANTPDIGDASDNIEVDFKHDELRIAFNFKFLVDALQVIDSHDIKIEFNGSLAPAIIKPEEDDGYLCLVMPVQVK